MKTKLLLLAAGLFSINLVVFSQELVVDGNMENELSWTIFSDPGAHDDAGNGDVPEAFFNYTADYPQGGDGGCLEVTGYGICSFFIYQKVTIIPGNKYSFSGLIKSIGEVPTNAWVELNLTKVEPVESAPADSSWFNYSKNSWMGDPYKDFSNIDGDFFSTAQLLWKQGKVDGTDSVLTVPEFTIPATETVTDWYVVIKLGCWNGAGVTDPTFDFLFDNISLKDITNGTSVASIRDKDQISVYPNPSNGIINITSKEGKSIEYSIFNLSGAVVKSGNLNGSSTIDLHSLNKGTYMIRLDDNTSSKFQKVVIK